MNRPDVSSANGIRSQSGYFRSQIDPATNTSTRSRSGRAATEVVLIVLVPCFCVLMWFLFDRDIGTLWLAPKHHSDIFNVVYSLIPIDAGTVASLQTQGQICFWDMASGELLGEIQSELSEVRFGAYSREQRLLVVGSAMGKLEVWDLAAPDGPIAKSSDRGQTTTCCQFSPDGDVLICAGDHGSLSFWEASTLERLDIVYPTGKSDTVRSLAISADGQRAITGLRNGMVQEWDLVQREHRGTFQLAETAQRPDSTIEAVAFLPGDKQFIAAVRSEGIVVWNLETGVQVQRYSAPLEGIRSGTLSSDSNRFIAGNDSGQVRLWDVTTGRHLITYHRGNAVIRAVASNGGATQIMSGDWDGKVQVVID